LVTPETLTNLYLGIPFSFYQILQTQLLVLTLNVPARLLKFFSAWILPFCLDTASSPQWHKFVKV